MTLLAAYRNWISCTDCSNGLGGLLFWYDGKQLQNSIYDDVLDCQVLAYCSGNPFGRKRAGKMLTELSGGNERRAIFLETLSGGVGL